MLKMLLAAPEWLPIGFDWAILPVAVLLTILALRESTRHFAASGFMVAAGFSAALLSLLLAASIFHLLGYGRAIVDLLINFGPSVTWDYLGTLLRDNGHRLLALVPMIVTTLFSGVAAAYLRRGQRHRTAI